MQAAELDVRFVPEHWVPVDAAHLGAPTGAADRAGASGMLPTHRVVRVWRSTVNEA